MVKRRLEKGVKYMETLEAKILREDEKTSLRLKFEGNILEILLTSNNANDIKNVFNRLILELKTREFEFKLIDDQQDLYYAVCQEYIRQLNNELKIIRQELVDNGLAEVELGESMGL